MTIFHFEPRQLLHAQCCHLMRKLAFIQNLMHLHFIPVFHCSMSISHNGYLWTEPARQSHGAQTMWIYWDSLIYWSISHDSVIGTQSSESHARLSRPTGKPSNIKSSILMLNIVLQVYIQEWCRGTRWHIVETKHKRHHKKATGLGGDHCHVQIWHMSQMWHACRVMACTDTCAWEGIQIQACACTWEPFKNICEAIELACRSLQSMPGHGHLSLASAP